MSYFSFLIVEMIPVSSRIGVFLLFLTVVFLFHLIYGIVCMGLDDLFLNNLLIFINVKNSI